MNVLVACEFSGIVRDAFRARGHNAWSCDLLPCEGDPRWHMRCSIRTEIVGWGKGRMPWDLMIAHPPCTRLTNSGVRWLHDPPKNRQSGYPLAWARMTKAERLKWLWNELDKAARFYAQFRNAPIPLKAIENPIMHKYARERINIGHRQIVQPWWFGDKAFKATGFELIGLPDLVPTNKLTPPAKGTDEHKAWSAVHRASPGPDRWKERSRTYQGIAKAMAEQWG